MIPSSGQNGLSRFESLRTRLPFRISGRHRLLAPHLGRLLVLAEALVGGRAQAAVVRPLDELDLGDELRLDPDDVALADPRHLRHLAERRRVALERLQLLQQPVDLAVVETGADVADVDELAALVGREDERAERPCATALAARVAGDHELLAAVALDLQPLARAPAREVAGAEPLRHDPLELLLLGRGEQRVAVVEALRELHDPVPLVEELLEPLAPLLERQVDHRLALDLEQVEHVVDDRRPALALLHRREAGPAVLVERADLAVDDAVRGLERLHELLGHVLEPLACSPGPCASAARARRRRPWRRSGSRPT